jgi:hypothetical protein
VHHLVVHGKNKNIVKVPPEKFSHLFAILAVHMPLAAWFGSMRLGGLRGTTEK